MLWLLCSGRGMSVFHCISFEAVFQFIAWSEECKYKKKLWKLVRRFGWQMKPEAGSTLTDLHRPFSHLYFLQRLDYWSRDLEFDLHLLWHSWGKFAECYNVEIFSNPVMHCSSQQGKAPCCLQALEGFWLLCASLHRSWCFFSFIKMHSILLRLCWRFGVWEFAVCKIISFLCLASAGRNVFGLTNSRGRSLEKGALVNWALLLQAPFEQYRIFGQLEVVAMAWSWTISSKILLLK